MGHSALSDGTCPAGDRVTTPGSGVDGAMRPISSTNEVRGMRESVTSYDNATVGSGSIVNDTKFTYNNFAQLTADYQSHSGAVNTGSSPILRIGVTLGFGYSKSMVSSEKNLMCCRE
jgi:hypothetical protein